VGTGGASGRNSFLVLVLVILEQISYRLVAQKVECWTCD